MLFRSSGRRTRSGSRRMRRTWRRCASRDFRPSRRVPAARSASAGFAFWANVPRPLSHWESRAERRSTFRLSRRGAKSRAPRESREFCARAPVDFRPSMRVPAFFPGEPGFAFWAKASVRRPLSRLRERDRVRGRHNGRRWYFQRPPSLPAPLPQAGEGGGKARPAVSTGLNSVSCFIGARSGMPDRSASQIVKEPPLFSKRPSQTTIAPGGAAARWRDYGPSLFQNQHIY